MSLDFPTNPINGQIYTFNNKSWVWTSPPGAWVALGSIPSGWSMVGNNIVYTSGNVGVGTSAPISSLDVAGNVRIGNSTVQAGIVASNGSYIPSNDLVSTDGTQTLTNKRVNTRAVSAGATSGTLTPNGDTTDVFNAFGLTGTVTIATPSGTPVDGQRLVIRLEDNGSSRTVNWASGSGSYRVVGTTLPTTTSAGKITYVGCMYNTTDVFWDVIAVVTQA